MLFGSTKIALRSVGQLAEGPLRGTIQENSVDGVSSFFYWPERIKTQPHDDRDNCFLHFDSKGPCGMTVNNDIDDDSATKHGDSHTRNSHRQSV